MHAYAVNHNHAPARGLILGLVAGVATSCGGGAGDVNGPVIPADTAVASITLTGLPEGNGFLVSHPVTLTATVRNAAGLTLFGRDIVWTSSNANVATAVGGLVNPIGPGTVQIRAAVGARAATADIIARHAIPVALSGTGIALTSTLYGGSLTVTTSPGAVGLGTVLTLVRAEAVALPATPRLVDGTAFVFGPDNTKFGAAVAISIAFDPAAVTSAQRDMLRIYRNTNGSWVLVESSGVAGAGNVVNATLAETGTYAILKP
jgi:hypothetical protein